MQSKLQPYYQLTEEIKLNTSLHLNYMVMQIMMLYLDMNCARKYLILDQEAQM